jgi:hypothetical protein
MKLHANQPEAAKILRVLVDGKPVAQAVSLDTEEGWVDILLPKVVKSKEYTTGQAVDITKDNSAETELEWETKRLYGKVDVVFNKAE